MKPSYGVIVGRFQVNDLHDGHMELFRQVRARHNAVIVFIGISPAGLGQNDPLDFPTRQRMIQAKFPEFTVLPLTDCRTDEEWSQKLDSYIATVVGPGEATLYGGRNSFVPRYHGDYAHVELALPIETQKVSGTDIRNEFSNKVIESPEFRAGMIYAAFHAWARVWPCIDIAIFNYDWKELLLGQKKGETEWRFIGGHAELKHGSYENGARAEGMEEATLDFASLDYVGSAVVDDWRYRNTPDMGIMTALFRARTSAMGAKAGDDVARVKWFEFSKLTENDFVPEHRPLFRLLLLFQKKEADKKDAEKAEKANGKTDGRTVSV